MANGNLDDTFILGIDFGTTTLKCQVYNRKAEVLGRSFQKVICISLLLLLLQVLVLLYGIKAMYCLLSRWTTCSNVIDTLFCNGFYTLRPGSGNDVLFVVPLDHVFKCK